MGYFLKISNEEVKLGDKLYYPEVQPTSTGFKVIKRSTNLDEKLLEKLLADGIIIEKLNKPVKTNIPMDINFYIEKLAEKKGWKVDKVYNFMNGINELSEVAALNIILKEIAIEMDTKYEDHIQDSPKIYVISTFDGRITEANKALIKNYRNFAAFRNVEDARAACKIVSPILKELFKDGRKKQKN